MKTIGRLLGSNLLGGGLVLVLVFQMGCAGKSTQGKAGTTTADASTQKVTPWNRALEVAWQDMNQKNRRPASPQEIVRASGIVSQVQPDFSELRREMKILVFPRRTMISSKSTTLIKNEFAPPLIYTFHALRLLACDKLAAEKLNKFPKKDRLFASVASEHNTDCAIINVRREYPDLRPAEYKNDLIGMTLYLDSNYRSYGYDTVVGYSRKDIQTFTVSKTPNDSLSSGLSLFPIDLPSIRNNQAPEHVKLQLPADPSIKAQLAKWSTQVKCSEGYQTRYKDEFGNSVRMYWCPKERWPSVIETDRYLAVVKGST